MTTHTASLTPEGSLIKSFQSKLGDKFPMMLGGVREAYATDSALVEHYFNLTLGWMVRAFGPAVIESIADGYTFFTTEANRSQALYEKTGAYEFSSFEECDRQVYQQQEYMRRYYWGVYAILFCWSHYVELMGFFLLLAQNAVGSLIVNDL